LINWNKSTIEIEFDVVAVNNSTMSLIISHNDRSWKMMPLDEGISRWSTEIVLPTKLSLEFGGKKSNDTIVDSDGNITANKSVVIKNIKLDGISCWEYWTELSTVLELDNSDEILLGKTITDNGRVDLIFDSSNAFLWLAKSKLSF
jgi:hypothetical protein